MSRVVLARFYRLRLRPRSRPYNLIIFILVRIKRKGYKRKSSPRHPTTKRFPKIFVLIICLLVLISLMNN